MARLAKLEAALPTYSIAQAKDQLSKLVEQTLAGEAVTITRHGKPVVDLRPSDSNTTGRPSLELLDKIEALAKSLPPARENAADMIRAMRDDF